MSDTAADVVVVGFGGAGVCAALEARAGGASVVVLDRFSGGGATAISGGVVYAGGGTPIQREAGVEDDPESMLAYLRAEVQGVVSEETLRDFCDRSVENLAWLAGHGVPFEASLCPVKTSYPTDDYYLYYSGNEGFSPFRELARPAPRGHRAKGRGLPGQSFYAPLKAAALAAGVTARYHCRATGLISDNGRVVGVEVSQLSGSWATLHGLLEARAIKVVNYLPGLGKRLRRIAADIERRHGVPARIMAEKGVILASGGFIYSRAMVEEHAPDYRRGMPLGTAGCAGDGIRLGQSVGGGVAHMGRVSAWRFLNPPEAFVEGALLNRQGCRYVNESLYGAAVGEELVDRNEGVGMLVIDAVLREKARGQIGRGKTQWFQTAPTWLNLKLNCRRAESLSDVARICRAPEAAVIATIEGYNAATAAGTPDAFGKEKRAVLRPPYFVIDCGIRSRTWPLPTLTLGGLTVAESTGAVQREDGSTVAGLYAAGRTAVGICSRQYVSGLSIADCVYSGRRAGRSVLG
jgi:3-oxo-5alpha-steroid 4-dehydrogenase